MSRFKVELYTVKRSTMLQSPMKHGIQNTIQTKTNMDIYNIHANRFYLTLFQVTKPLRDGLIWLLHI